MTLLASWPGWMTFLLVMMVVSSVMRLAFGGFARWGRWEGRFPAPPHRSGKLSRQRATGEIARLDTALAERDEVIEDLQRRLLEVESRLDFTERLLAERKEPIAVSGER